MRNISTLSVVFAIVASPAFAQEYDANEKQLAEVYSEDYTGKT